MGGMVVAPQVPAVETGVNVLRQGGNAIDAAVTAAFVQMVVDPQMCGIGGFGAATVRTADGEEICIDFNGTAGSRATPEMWQDIVVEQDWTGYGYHLQGQVNDIGYGSIMTPGTVAGMAELLERFGTISWQAALQDAIRISDAGYVVTPELWRLWNTPGYGLHAGFGERISATEPSRAIYYKPDGSGYLPGERILNPDHTRTLQRLAEGGPREFYEARWPRNWRLIWRPTVRSRPPRIWRTTVCASPSRCASSTAGRQCLRTHRLAAASAWRRRSRSSSTRTSPRSASTVSNTSTWLATP